MFKSKARSMFLALYFIVILLAVSTQSSPVDITIKREYYGRYISKHSMKPFDYLEQHQGEIFALFYGSPTHKSVNSVEIILLDPTYLDERVVLIDIKGTINVNQTTGIWQNDSHSLTYSKKWKQRTISMIQQSDVSSTITFENLDSEDYQEISITIRMKGQQFEFTGQLTYHNQIVSTMFYSIYVSTVIALQIYSAYCLMRLIEGPNAAHGTKLSVVTLCLCNIQDFSLTMTHIQYIMSSSSGFIFFILPSIFYITLFVVFQMKMLFLVWKSHNIQNLQNTQQLRRKLTAFYIQFYLGLFAFLTLNYFYGHDQWMVILRNLVLLPQIIHNIRVGQKPAFNPHYIFGLIGSRILIPVYQYSCPSNRFKLAPNPTLVLILISIYAFEVLLIALQNRLGSRFFVPKQLLPNYYEYRLKVQINEHNKGQDCAICLQSWFQKQASMKAKETNQHSLNDSIIQQELLGQVNIMKTPCNHKFHEQCLTQWLDVKLECPTCRTTLPPL